MGNIIQATELEVGDLYRTYRPASAHYPGRTEVRRVTGRRTIRYVETYSVLETLSIDGRELHGEVSLRADVTVEKLERVDLRDVTELLKVMPTGASLIATYFDGGFYV